MQPVAFEKGGSWNDKSAAATIVVGESGERLKPLYSPHELDPNSKQAGFCIEIGYHLLTARNEQGRKSFEAWQIIEIGDVHVDARLVGYGDDEASHVPAYLQTALEALFEKAACQSCRHSHYGLERALPARVRPPGADERKDAAGEHYRPTRREYQSGYFPAPDTPRRY